MPQSAATLRRNIALNGLSNVIVHQTGLSHKRGTMHASIENKRSSATAVLSAQGGDIEVLVTTLDELLRGEGCNFIKIDTEGMEPDVLRGAEETLRAYRPAVFFEVNVYRLRRYGFSVGDIARVLRRQGYAFYLPRGDKLYPLWSLSFATAVLVPREYFFRTGRSAVLNVLALPKERPAKTAESPARFAVRQLIELAAHGIAYNHLIEDDVN